MWGLDALLIFFFQFSATEWTVTTRALAVSNSLACIHMLILVHQQECMFGHCNAWTVSYCTLMDYATVSYWYICMSFTTSPLTLCNKPFIPTREDTLGHSSVINLTFKNTAANGGNIIKNHYMDTSIGTLSDHHVIVFQVGDQD